MPFRESWLVLGPFLVVLGFLAGEPFISGIGVVVVAIGAVARYWSRHVFDRLTLRRTVRQRRVFVDEPATLHAELENAKPLPLPWFEWRLAVAEHATFPGEQLSAAAAPGFSWLVRRGAIGWYERQSWDFEFSVAERGYHQIGPASLRSADLLGLFPRYIEDVSVDHLVVFPRVYTIPELGLPPNRPFGELKGRNRIFEDPRRIAGIREYREGDPLKRIDWKATARSGELQSRVYEPSATLQLYVLVNIDTLEHSWEGYRKHDLERTVSVAASVAVWGAEERFAVGLLANGSFPGSDRPLRLPPSRSSDQVTRVLEGLAMVQPLTMGELAGVIEKERGRIAAGSTIVLVASLIPEPLAAAVRRLAAEGHPVTVVGTSDRVDTSLLGEIPFHSVAGAFRTLEERG